MIYTYKLSRNRSRDQRAELRHNFSRNLSQLFSSATPRRPHNAPPTYDDATKNDNRGFVDDENGELPPSYSSAQFSEVTEGSAAATAVSTRPANTVTADNEVIQRTQESISNRSSDNNTIVEDSDRADVPSVGVGNNNSVVSQSNGPSFAIDPSDLPSHPPPYSQQDPISEDGVQQQHTEQSEENKNNATSEPENTVKVTSSE